MKASELINELQNLIREHGDLPVNFDGGGFDSSVENVYVYDRNGNDPSTEDPAAEFYIHLGRRASPTK